MSNIAYIVFINTISEIELSVNTKINACLTSVILHCRSS